MGSGNLARAAMPNLIISFVVKMAKELLKIGKR